MKTIKFKYYQILKRLGYKIPKYIVLEYAKQTYLTKTKKWGKQGMCYHIENAFAFFNLPFKSIKHFPKFNAEFCDADCSNYTRSMYWWNVDKRRCRIKAFDKLIKYYKEHKEYI